MSETDGFRDFGIQQAKEPKPGEAAVRSTMVNLPPVTASAIPSLAQDGAQTQTQSLIDLSQLAGMDVFEASEPALQRPVEVRHDDFHAPAIVPARLGFDGFAQLAQASGPHQPDQTSPATSFESIAEKVEMTVGHAQSLNESASKACSSSKPIVNESGGKRFYTMAKIGELASLKILREKSFGLYLDGGELGEVLLPHREVPKDNVIGGTLEVFLYTDSEDRPVATLKRPNGMPGEFAKLKCVAVTGVGAFLDWGLPKDLLVPFREQKTRMEPGKNYLVHVHVDPVSARIIASARISRHLDQTPPSYQSGDEVELMIYGKTDLGYKAIVNGRHGGLLFAEGVFQPLQAGEKTKGYVSGIRADGKIDLTLHAPGRARVLDLEERILAELRARGGYWGIGDHCSAAEIHEELGASKRSFKQAVGALFKKRLISLEERGIRLVQ